MRILSLVLSLCFTNALYANWLVDSDTSSIHFLSTKKSTVTEAHEFEAFSGTLDEAGNLTLSIDLSSVETRIPIRNKRMKEHLFQVEQFATATVSGNVAKALKKLDKSSVTTQKVKATLSLHGVEKKLDAQVSLVKSADGSIVASTTAPILLSTEDFGLLGGVAKLQELAKLPSITPIVPVSFNLTFKPE